MDWSNEMSSEPASRTVKVRLLGTGAAAPKKVLGQGMTVTRTSAGLYKLTFADAPGVFAMASSPSLQGATPGNLKQCTVVFDTWDATTKSIEVSLWDSAGAARDLAANEWLSFDLTFKHTSV